MLKKDKNRVCISKTSVGLFILFGLTIIVILALLVPNTDLFKGQLPNDAGQTEDNVCRSLKIITVPSSLRANQNAVIITETVPSDWDGEFIASSSSGIIGEESGKTGSYITTREKILSYSGGEADSRITIQASGIGNENCADSVIIEEGTTQKCESLEIETYPSPVPPNESIEISIKTTPENWTGSFFINTDSGKLQLTQADSSAHGENTNTLITSLRKIIYNGGKQDEQITVKVLGEGNENCTESITIGSEL
jgi:hypothetical protein